MLYAGYDAGNHPLQLNGDELEAQRWRWWVYQANDLLHICYEALLKFSLDVLVEYPAGVSLSRLVGETAGRLLSAHDGKTPDWESFFWRRIPLLPIALIRTSRRTSSIFSAI